MPTGEVEITGTIITSGAYPGLGESRAFDDDFSTNFASLDGDGDGWIGIDLGSGKSARLTRFRFAPRPSSDTVYEDRMIGLKLQASNDPAFGSGVVDLLSITTMPPRNELTERAVSTGGVGYRCYRVIQTAAKFCDLTELLFIADAATLVGSPTTKPVAPTMAPWGGRYQASQSVTLASLTTDAVIRYTVDGSAVSGSSTIYSGPITVSANTTVKAQAFHAVGGTAARFPITATFAIPKGFTPAYDVKDATTGRLVTAFGGNVVRAGGYWYRCGTSTNMANAGGVDTVAGLGAWLYKSTDLVNWQRVGEILPASTTWLRVIRHKLLYRPAAGKWVLYGHGYTAADTTDRAVVATADNIEGPYTLYTETWNPDGLGFKDFNVFTDGDGTAYLIYTDGTQTDLWISQLSADGLSTTGSKVKAIAGQGREAPVLFNRKGRYFLITSTGNYYDSGSTYDVKYITSAGATPLTGWPAWTSAAALFASDPTATTYNAQPREVVEVPGYVDGFVYGSDRWNATELYDSRDVILPLAFPTSSTLQASMPAEWTIAGTFPASGGAVPRISIGVGVGV